MSFNSAAKPADIPLITSNDSTRGDFNSQEQWEAINKHMQQMNVWTEESPSPLSTSPANRNTTSSVVTRSHSSQHNPSYRKSEGDIRGTGLTVQKPCNPPQSAPIRADDFELKWGKENTKPRIEILPESSVYPLPSAEQELVDVSDFIVPQSFSNQSNPTSNNNDRYVDAANMKEHMHVGHVRSKGDDEHFHYMKPGSASPLQVLRSSTSNPSMKLHNAPAAHYKPNDAQPALYALPHQTSSPLLHVQSFNKSSPSARRKSAPIASVGMRKNNYFQRSGSAHQSTFFPGFSDETRNLALVKPVQEEEETLPITDVNNDKEYTRGALWFCLVSAGLAFYHI